VLVLPSHLRLYLPSCLFPSGFSNKILYAFLLYLFTLILTSTFRSLKWSLSKMFPHQMLFRRPIYSLTIWPTCPPNRNRVFTTRSRSAPNCIVIRYPLFSFVLSSLRRNIFVRNIFFCYFCYYRKVGDHFVEPPKIKWWNYLRFVWLGTGGGHLWVRWGTFGFHKCGEFLD
jgi:hypothetical protein